MQTQITVRHFNASHRLRNYASEKLSKLQRFYDGITDAHIVLSQNGNSASPEGKSAEIIIRVYRQTLSAQVSASTHEEAIDRCIARLRRQIMRYKAKLRRTDAHYQK